MLLSGFPTGTNSTNDIYRAIVYSLIVQRHSFGGRLISHIVLCVCVLLLAEALSWGGLSLLQKAPATYRSLYAEQLLIAGEAIAEPDPDEASPERVLAPDVRVFHPYIGFMHGNNIPELQDLAQNDEVFTVLLLGGSVARHFFTAEKNGSVQLLTELTKADFLAGKKLRYVNLGMDGAREPQQLLLLNYLLSLGADIDMVINLDGFNEVHMPEVNRIRGAYPFYPEEWSQTMRTLLQNQQGGALTRMRVLEFWRVRAARWIASSPFRFSMTSNLLWSVYDHALQSVILGTQSALDKKAYELRRVEALGPVDASGFTAAKSLLEESIETWEQGSLLMHDVTQLQGITYFHVLQPNQYVPDSKPHMTEHERKKVFANKSWKYTVEEAFPLMRERGKVLRSKGVVFLDMTNVFAGETQETYSDICCHLTPYGMQVLGETMGKGIQMYLDSYK